MATSTPCTVALLAQSCGALSAVLTASLGPHGNSILMEKDGKVLITKDGVDILSSLRVEDPILQISIKSILRFARSRGDGSKSCMLHLKTLLSVLDSNVLSDGHSNTGYRFGLFRSNSTMKRIQMINNITEIRSRILPDIQSQFVKEYANILSVDDDNFATICEYYISTSLSAQLPTIISKVLTKLVFNYLFHNGNRDVRQRAKLAVENYQDVIFQVYKLSLTKSHLLNGYIISRNFKVFTPRIKSQNHRVVLWSIPLIENKDEIISLPLIRTKNENIFMTTILYKNILLERALKILQSQKVTVILSSDYFPEWAVATCRRYSISLADMIPEKEFTRLVSELKTCPVQCQEDLINTKLQSNVNIDLVQFGQSRFVRIDLLNSMQIVLCATTPSQCDQFTRSILKTLKQINNWFIDSQLFEHHKANTSVQTVSNLLYWCRCDGFAGVISSIINESYFNNSVGTENQRKILNELFLCIPRELHKKTAVNSKSSFLKHLNKVRNSLLQNQAWALEMFSIHSIESAFEQFSVIDNVLQAAEIMLRIDCVVPARCRIIDIISACDNCEDNYDNQGS